MMSQYEPRKDTSAEVVVPGAVRSMTPRMIPVIPWSQKSHQMLVCCGCEAAIVTSSAGICDDATRWDCGEEGGINSGDACRFWGNGSAVSAFSAPAVPASSIVSDPIASLTRGANSLTRGVNL